MIAPDIRTRATWGELPDRRPRMRLLNFKPLRKGKLIGFATVELPIGLKIRDLPILAGKNGAFAALPAKPQIARDGQLKTDINGKAQYVAILEWRDRALAGQFSDALVALILEAYPGALGDGDTP